MSDAVFPFHTGGKETRYHFLTEQLVALGATVDVYTMRWWGTDPSTRVGSVAFHAISPLFPMYRNGRRSITQAILFSLSTFRLLSFHFDVIEADHMPYLPLVPLRLVAWIKRVPLVVTWHEVWDRRYWCSYLGVAGNVAYAVERLARRIPDAIVAVSPETQRRLLPSVSTVATAGVAVDDILTVAPASRGYDFLFVGRLISHKHVDRAIESLAQLSGRGSEATLAILGQGPEEADLRRLVEQLGMTDRVSFLGHLDDDHGVYGLMKACRVLLLPSTREGYGLVALEAIACGLPVISTDHPDNYTRQLIRHGATGLLCRPDLPSLRSAMQQALDRPVWDQGAADTLVDAHRWSATATTALSVYRAAGATA